MLFRSKNEKLAVALDENVRRTKQPGFREHRQKSKAVRIAIENVLANFGITNEEKTHRIFDLVKNQEEY